MKKIKYNILIALAMTAAAASLSGCGSTGSGSAATEQSQAAKADVTISARFPSSGDASKSLVPAGTRVYRSLRVINRAPRTSLFSWQH